LRSIRVARCSGIVLNKHLGWLLATLSIGVAFARLAVHNLANFRPVSNDEVELMEVAYQLATRGVLGSEMYEGFFGADQHHLWTLPVQHVIDAVVFVVFGTSVFSARAVSVVAALTAVIVVGWLAYRWYGLFAAVLCALLLTAWASDLTAGQTSLPLLDVARAARYDILAVVLAWLTITLLDAQVRRPTVSRPRALLLGLCGGLATLAQFYAGAVLAVVIVGWWWVRGRSALRGLVWSSLGAASVLLAWAAYLARYQRDFAGQVSVYGTRGDFLQPAFYTHNVLSEPLRFAQLVDGDLNRASTWLLVVALPALAWSAWRAVVKRAPGDRLLVTSAVMFGGLLIVLDSTKTPLYAIAILPMLCLALSGFSAHVAAWATSRGSVPKVMAVLVSLAILAPLANDSIAAWQLDFAESGEVSAYLEVGQRIDAALAPGATVLGPERWWWALHTHPYRSLRAQWFRWTAQQTAGEQADLRALLLGTEATSIVVNDNVRGDVRAFPEALQQQFWDFLDRCTTLTDVVEDPTYSRIEIYRIDASLCSAVPRSAGEPTSNSV
jgi:hypothetical protein